MITIFYLSELQPGETACIYKTTPSKLQDRLYDLGFFGGTPVECVSTAPFGGPKAYLIRGTVIALRRDDARSVLLKPPRNEEKWD